MTYDQVATVNFQGQVIAFARGAGSAPGVPGDLYFNVLGLGADSQTDDLDWSGFQPLVFPDEVRPVGMNIVNVPSVYADGNASKALIDDGAPFRVLAGPAYIYVFRETRKKTLLCNRFRLVRRAAGGDAQTVSYAMDPAWEVRFQRSGKPDTPADARDMLGYLSPDGDPFIEPSLELFMVRGLVDGNYAPVFLPTSDPAIVSCALFVADREAGDTAVYVLPMDKSGAFDLTGKHFSGDTIPPDHRFSLADPAGAAVAIDGAPAAVFYSKQERTVDSQSGSILVKRSGRVLLAARGKIGDAPPTLVSVDFGVGSDGSLAPPPRKLVAGPVGVANYAASFDAGASVTFAGVRLAREFALDFWIYPRSFDAPLQRIVWGSARSDAPYACLSQGTRILVGFTGQNGQPASALTGSVVRQQAWNHVQIAFAAGKGFTVFVNGNQVPVTASGSGDAPNDAPLDTLSGGASRMGDVDATGYVGDLDELRIYADAAMSPTALVADWPFDTIEYTRDEQPLDPPLTPNTKDPANPGRVFGAQLVPSTSPASSDSGTLYFTPGGLTIYVSYFEGIEAYGQMLGSPVLLDGAEGLVHCYFRGEDDLLCVMQLDAESARAIYRAPWVTKSGTSESGFVDLVAVTSGTSMNGAVITVTPSDVDAAYAPWFCDMRIQSPSTRVETWRGIPRALSAFGSVLNGDALGDASDSRLAGGRRTYFDATGAVTAAYVALGEGAFPALLAFVSRQADEMPLARVAVTATASENAVDVALEFATPRWEGVGYRETWKGVPAAARAFIDTLSGVSSSYRYSDPTSNVASYTINAVSSLVGTNPVILFVHPDMTSVQKLDVADGSSPTTTTVTIECTVRGATLSAMWRDVPRKQDDFARTLERANERYDYAKLASGDYEAIGRALIVTTNGAAAQVANVDRAPDDQGNVPPDASLLVGASLFSLFPTATFASGARVAPTSSPVPAAAFQKASYVQDGAETALTTGSTLVRSVPETTPTQGGAAMVQDTAALTGGTADIVQLGVNGGWLNEPVQRTLTFEPRNWVDFSTDVAKAPSIDALTIPGDMTLEMWCKPLRSNRDEFAPNQRLLTFSRKQDPADPRSAVQYLAGLRDAPCLLFGKTTRVRSAFDTPDGTVYVWFSPEDAGQGKPASGIVASLSWRLITEPILEVRLNGDRHIEVGCPMAPSAQPIVWNAPVEAGEWYQVAVGFKSTYKRDGQSYAWVFQVDLFVNGERRAPTVSFTFSVPDTRYLATMVLGDIAGVATLPMSANECAFFRAPLTEEEVARFFEQRVSGSEQALVFKWMLIEGQGGRALNTAATGRDFDAEILPAADWRDFGLYAWPVLGHGANIGVLRDSPVIHGWSHLAMVHQAGYALHLRGAQSASCGHDASLDLTGGKFALEAWVMLDADGGTSQTILAKGDDYQLWIPYTLKPRFEVSVVIAGTPATFAVNAPTPLTRGKAAYIAINYELVTVTQIDGDKRTPQYELHIDMYVDGKYVARAVPDSPVDASQPPQAYAYTRFDDTVNLTSSKADFQIGRMFDGQPSRYLSGYIADVRVWNRVLTADEVQRVYASHRAPSDTSGLISYWRFSEMTGKTAFDARGTNDAKLSDSGLMVYFTPTASNRFYVNAAESVDVDYVDSLSRVGGYGTAEQFSFAHVNASPALGFWGQLDQVRIWRILRTAEQLADSMNRPLAGSDAGLAGYWTFGAGSGPRVADDTGRGNDGTLACDRGASLAVWGVSQAPVSNEAGAVYNILGGISTFALRRTSSAPAVVEYADVQRDAYGAVFSVMKRAYAFVDDGELVFVTRYEVGDLDTVYIGQAQTKPSLIGFIEGAPPVPSENQTLPYWDSDFTKMNTYAFASSVNFQTAEDTFYTFNADRASKSASDFAMKGGLYVGGQWGTAEGIGFEVTQRDLVFDGRLGDQNKIASESKSGDPTVIHCSSTKTLTSAVRPGGAWEGSRDPKSWVNPTVGRRFVPANTGYALVKSLTADVYASVLRSTGTMVKMTLVPNRDIPEDANIIDFPINPAYVKNGTLDGKVGLANDPSYTDADVQRGSYFKPLEAYALKRRIERDEKQLEAYYQQYDVDSLSSRLQSQSAWEDMKASQKNTPTFDWGAHLAKRNIANTYVWTAGGGTYAEETKAMNVYTESYGAVASMTTGLGVVFDFKLAGPVAGPFVEIDYLSSTTTEVNVVRSKHEGASFALSATVNPDWFLTAPQIAADGAVSFGDAPTEGKVDDYRYMAFFLAPDPDNFKDFMGKVVDPNWLENSSQANAAALREATAAENGAWRILFRVTYVSRIPPSFQPTPSESPSTDVTPPANLELNTLMVDLVRSRITTPAPTPPQIGDALARVLGSVDAPGALNDILPWWGAFVQDSLDYRKPAAAILRALREDLLQYMIQTYATEVTP